MKRTRWNGVFALAAVLAFAVGEPSSRAEEKAPLNSLLRPYGISMAGDSRVESEFERKSGGISYNSITAYGGGLRLEMDLVRPVSPEYAANYSRAKYALFLGAYEVQSTPYQGVVSNRIACPEDRKPQVRTLTIFEVPVEVLLANGTERFSFGVWEDDLIKTKGAFCVAYDKKSQTLVEMSAFQPLSSYRPEVLLNLFKGLSRLKASPHS